MSALAQIGRAAQWAFSLDSDVGEDLLAALLLLKEEKLLDSVFYGRPCSLREFLDLAKSPNGKYFVFMAHSLSNVGQVQMAGIGWAFNILGPPGAQRADVGIVLRRRFWSLADEIMKTGIQHLFDNQGIDVLYFVTPYHNKASQRLATRVGFTEVGDLPMWYVGVERRDAVMAYLTKSFWRGSHDV